MGLTFVERVRARVESGGLSLLDDAGGEDEILAHAAEVIASEVFPDVVGLLARNWTHLAAPARGVELVATGLAACTHALAFMDALDAILAHEQPAKASAVRLSTVLLGRVAHRGTRAECEIAGAALDGCVRLAVGALTPKLPVLAALVGVKATDDQQLVRRLPRLLSVCYERWRDPDLVAALEALLDAPHVEADAAFELGAVSLLDAFGERAQEAIVEGVRKARGWFSRAEHSDEEQTDAALWGRTLDVLLALLNGADPDSTAGDLRAAYDLVRLRRRWLYGMNRTWLSPRVESEGEWLRLLTLVQAASARLKKGAWLDPALELDQILAAYVATRTVRIFAFSEPGSAGDVLEPLIEGQFLRRESHLALLKEWLGTLATDPATKAAAEAVLEHVEEARKKKVADTPLAPMPLIANLESTFIDAGVLIAAARGNDRVSPAAQRILDDPRRRFVTSDFVWLETVPSARYRRRVAEVEFYEEFFATARRAGLYVSENLKLVRDAKEVAGRFGLGGMDALHVVAARRARVVEIVTTERPNKPLVAHVPADVLRVTTIATPLPNPARRGLVRAR